MKSRTSAMATLTTLMLATALLLMPGFATQSALAAVAWTYTRGPGNSPSSALAYDSTHNLLYVGVGDAGVFKYSGATWSNTGGGVVGDTIVSLAYDSVHNILYAGSRDGHGVWKYNGATWSNTGGGVSSYNIDSLAYDSMHNILYAGTLDSHGVWMYNGAAWSPTGGAVASYEILSLAYDAVHNILYAGTWGDGFWKYAGGTWSNIGGAVSSYTVDSLAYDATHNMLYAGTTLAGVWKYNGATWSATGGGVLSSYRIFSLAYDATHNALYAGTGLHGVWKYNGATWTDTEGAVADCTIDSLAYDSGHNLLYAGTDANGVWSTNGTPVGTSTIYLAEGSTAWMDNCSEYISIENPNPTAVTAKLTYMVQGSGSRAGPTVSMPANSQATVNPADTVGKAHFSTRVECLQGKSIAADRTMVWNNGQGEEGHCAVGVTAPAKTWYMPEGSSNWGFETWTLVQNPGSQTADVTLTYMTDTGQSIPIDHQVPAGSRDSFSMSTDIGARDASIMVTSNVPVIPERAMYRNNRREGHDSVGTTTPAADYYLAEGATGYNVGYVTYVLVQNPQASSTNVTITYQTAGGQVAGPSFTMSPESRKTIRLNDQLSPNTDVSTRVHGSAPIIAERAMYWNNGTGEACHDSIGMASSHTTFYLPDGETSNGRETWTLVQNPNASAVNVEVAYLKAGGGAMSFTSTIPANSRKTFNMADKISSGRASIMVTCKTSGKKVMVERAMYWNSRGAGTDTIGGYSD